MHGESLYMSQKGQGARIESVDAASKDYKQAYMEQRARGAYSATIYQPEAAFDLSVAAQHQDPTVEEIKALNTRLRLQNNLGRGLRYVPVDLQSAQDLCLCRRIVRQQQRSEFTNRFRTGYRHRLGG